MPFQVGSLKMVSAEAVRLLLWILGFMTFGYGTGEFEVTKERLGCYRYVSPGDPHKDAGVDGLMQPRGAHR